MAATAAAARRDIAHGEVRLEPDTTLFVSKEAFMARVVVGVIGVLLAASSAMAQGRGAPACTTVACDVQADWAGNTNGLIGIAYAMP